MNPTESIEDLPPNERLFEAGKRYAAAEQAFEQAKRDLSAACDEYNAEGDEDIYLPRFIWDNGNLYELTYERAATPKFRQIPPDIVAVAPAVG